MPSFTLLCDNDEVSGRIYAQFCALYCGNILQESQKNSFLTTSISLMNKLSAVRYHQNNFENREKASFKVAQKYLKNNPNEERAEFPLAYEFEAFLFQVKSSLDILVKLLNATADPNIIATTTFGDKGNRIIKGLEKFKEKKGTKISTVDKLQGLIREQQDAWLNDTIEMRDYLNHISSFNGYRFIPKKLPNGEIVVVKPLVAGRPAIELLRIIGDNLCMFCQDFFVLSIDLIIPTYFALSNANQKHMYENFGKYGKYIRYEYTPQNKMSGGRN